MSEPEGAEAAVPLLVERFELEQLVCLDCVSPPFIGERPVQLAHLPLRPELRQVCKPCSLNPRL